MSEQMRQVMRRRMDQVHQSVIDVVFVNMTAHLADVAKTAEQYTTNNPTWEAAQ